MRVLALGGAGAMGVAAVRTATLLPGIDEIVIADRDLAAAQRVKAQLATSPIPVRALRVDVEDPGELRCALDESDLVLNTVGPYYRFGVPVLLAAIAARTHYLDLCDDWEPTLEMLALNEAAREAGVCAVIGMGASPGVSNLLAMAAARRLDRVDDVYTAWPVDVPAEAGGDEVLGIHGRPSAAAIHWMQQISGTIALVEGGRIMHREPVRPVTLALPGNRCGTGYTVGHPEPVTLHRTIRPTGAAACLMIATPGMVAFLDGLRRDIDRGRLDAAGAARQLLKPGLLRGIRSAITAGEYASHGTLPPFFAVAYGVRDGRRQVVLARLSDGPGLGGFTDDMAGATGIPLALAMSQVIDGTARRPGVHPPEATIDADRFFAELGGWLGHPGSCVEIEQDSLAEIPAH
ncbi:saccharopine dehydrogenase [Nocardia sp. SYP-A9097]|uniref:saccharopine dehydrogenase family protein n=1 Tax=Nocardia sp. SYP-A9097 TaxID=2663237 RepID=UPI00129BE314|nr:saccharopine dehydrogenase NADP-binding domain-containing protein [Nocardia sp. SYP-A9097]MRH88569.1 saccharopine dehydrogenase [Nocardia sp. SYP-A9097]